MPFTVLTEPDTVRLIAGEDFRYTFTDEQLETWFPNWLKRFDGQTILQDTFSELTETQTQSALSIVERLRGERVLIESSAQVAHQRNSYHLQIEGSASWAKKWSIHQDEQSEDSLLLFCQDRLDYQEVIEQNAACLSSQTPWLWVTTGPMNRAFVSPLFLPHVGPCLACLLNHFRRLSPAPELYDALAEHARQGGEISPSPFPQHALSLLQQLVQWKVSLTTFEAAPSTLYRLHVVDVDRLEVTSHRVFIDPECAACRPWR